MAFWALLRQLDRWKKNLENTQCEANSQEALLQVRGDYESVMKVYEAIQADEYISEKEFADTFAKKMAEVEETMLNVEDIMSKLVVLSQEARAAREEEQVRSRGGVPERGSGGNSQKWNLNRAFKPETKMNFDMTVQELQIW